MRQISQKFHVAPPIELFVVSMYVVLGLIVLLPAKLAQAQGKPSQGAPPAQNCPSGQEWRLQKTYGCHPKLKPDLDPRCGPDFVSKFQAKQECLFNEDLTACLSLTLTPAGISAVGGAAGSAALGAIAKFVSQLQKSVMKGLAPEVAKKYDQAIVDVVEERALANRARDLVASARERALANLMKKKGGSQESDPQKAHESLMTETRRLVGAANRSNNDPKFHTYLDAALNGERILMSRVQQVLTKTFPNEMKSLEPDLRALADANLDFMNLKNKRLNPPEKGNRHEFEKETQAEIESVEKRISKISNSIEQKAVKNPRLGLAQALLLHDIKLMDAPSVPTHMEFLERIKKSDIESHPKSHPKNGPSSSLSGVGVIAGGVATSNLGKSDVDFCKTKFGFSAPEIDYLTNDRTFFPAKASREGINNCENFSLKNPIQALYDMTIQHGGVPKGICSVALQMDTRTEQLVGSQENSPEQLCSQNYKDENAEVKTDSATNKTTGTFRVEDNLQYEIPYIKIGGKDQEAEGVAPEYPDFRYLKALNVKRGGASPTPNPIKTNEMRQTYYMMHPPQYLEDRPDLRNFSLPCHKIDAHSNLGHICKINQSVLKAKLTKTFQPLCSLLHSSPAKPPAQVGSPATK